MADSSLRLLLMLQQIPREPRYVSSQQLHARLADAGYSVSLRTVQRDLVKLSSHFPLIQSEPSGQGNTGVSWAFSQHGQHMAFPGMDAVTALTVSMALEHLQSLLPPQVLQHLEPWQLEAEERLQKLNSSKYQSWMDKVRVSPQHVLQAPQVDAETVGLIYEALLENRQFCATYKGKSERVIHPYGLVQQGRTLYLLCRFYDFEDVRITALHRFEKVELLDEPIRPFPAFNIDDYLNTGAMQWALPDPKLISLELRVNQWLKNHLEESPLSEQQLLVIDDEQQESYLVKAEMLDGRQLRRWLLSLGSDVEVIAPKGLRDWMASIVKAQADRYLE